MTKFLFCAALLSTISAKSQKIALLNTDFKSPIIYTDSVTVQQLSSHLFPVSVNDFDTLYANLEYIDNMLSIRQRSKMKSFELHSGRTIIKIVRVPFSNGDRYIIAAGTTIGEVKSNLNLTDIRRSNKKNEERIKTIMNYIKMNKSLFKPPNGIHPKIYNAVIITD